MNILDLIQGFLIGGSLILAIGPQNLFVINQGLKREYVFTTVLFCSLSDSILIVLGIKLSNIVTNINPYTITILKVVGGIWLIYYGLNKIIKINNMRNINNIDYSNSTFKKILITLFLITYANPHVYLDTIILIGSISTNFKNQLFFGLGAILASFIFFISLGYLSKFLSKYIYSNKTWFWIDLMIGILMILYGLKFIFF
tara:strand:+ start:447 stop:1046 length:600 start_codon:yes stop_codon:yes gene_type:complete